MRLTVKLSLAVIAGLVYVTPAAAVQNVTGCFFNCTQNCQLQSNITCTTEAANHIQLASGADLDLRGYKITCTHALGCNGSAVVIGASNSVVKDTGLNGNPLAKGGIYGDFVNAVDCNSKPGSRVTGIVVNGSAATAAKNCETVDNNILIGGEVAEYTMFAVSTTGVSDSDSITNNYISWFGRAIDVQGVDDMTIDHNTIVQANALTPNVGITFSLAEGALTVTNNTLLSADDTFTPINPNGTATVAFNRCDSERAGCAACIANGDCIGFEHSICP